MSIAVELLQSCVGDSSTSADQLCARFKRSKNMLAHERLYPADHNGWQEVIDFEDDSRIVVTVTPHPPIK